MKILVMTCTVLTFALAAETFAQQPRTNENGPTAKSIGVSPTTTAPTEDMWFYIQELRRHDDPYFAVRRKAETRALQRRNRLASMKWFGFSNQRPQASPMPWYGTYSPRWVGNSWDPSHWVGSESTRVGVLLDYSAYRRF